MAVIGFGEAGMALTPAGSRGFDVRQDDAKRDDFARCGVEVCNSAADAVTNADVIFSLVTADQALAAAAAAAPHLAPGSLWFDFNSVSPDTKRAAAAAIDAAGGRYVDVAVMAPVHPAARAVLLLIAGPHVDAAIAVLGETGFTNIRAVGGPIGSAAAIKMIRSVMIKGIEALTAECAMAGDAAGVLPEVLASLGPEWAGKFDYNLDRMMVHGMRRAAEMGEVVATLEVLGTGSAMARATREWQGEIGALGLAPPPGLAAKLDLLQGRMREDAA